MWGLPILFGCIIGLSLGLTGGGGAIFAVPLLVYGMGVPPREAVGLSLAVVGATAVVGAIHRWFLGEIGIRTGALFAIAGMLGAPAGVWFAGQIPESLLLLLFAGLMVVVAIQLWRHANDQRSVPEPSEELPVVSQQTFRRDAAGRLVFTTRSTIALLLLGLMTGVLSGLFGVGGGFIIVPTLVLITGMPIQRAVGTSMMVIALVSLSGVTAHAVAGRDLALSVAVPFGLGAVGGLFVGEEIGHRIAGNTLQRGFAVAVLAVAVFVIMQSLVTST